jgi:phosphatidylserine decarboxylase
MIVATGVYYALFLLASGLLVGYLTRPWAGIPFYILCLFCLWFFRDPEREIPAGPVAVSPADGKVVLIRPEADGRTRLAIFLNVFDVHVNRSPIAGVIEKIQYRPGKFLVASHDEASLENEQNTLVVKGADGVSVEFSQIAGLIARRIVCYKKPGDAVRAGDRIGLIKFGSRVDLLFGSEWKLEVAVGQRVAAGSSIIARRK